MGKDFFRISRNILPKFFLQLLLSLFLGSLHAAPSPIPRERNSPSNYFIGSWEICDCGYLEIWTFYRDGKWTCKGKYRPSIVHGTWEIRHKEYLHITYLNIHIVHKIGTRIHKKYDATDGSEWPNLKLIFVKRIVENK